MYSSEQHLSFQHRPDLGGPSYIWWSTLKLGSLIFAPAQTVTQPFLRCRTHIVAWPTTQATQPSLILERAATVYFDPRVHLWIHRARYVVVAVYVVFGLGRVKTSGLCAAPPRRRLLADRQLVKRSRQQRWGNSRCYGMTAVFFFSVLNLLSSHKLRTGCISLSVIRLQ